jgi:hypothetical protein
MKRSEFLKKLGIGLGVAIIAPQVLADMPAKEEIVCDLKPTLVKNFDGTKWVDYDFNGVTVRFRRSPFLDTLDYEKDQFYKRGWIVPGANNLTEAKEILKYWGQR